ncbi:hypothetical protein RhiirA5_360193 [Rhizophagus irregularis]|uniref:Uncharacterized protein n=2 Tax=Rhizophagus irregularis TaxID=588596 RepID=A0A2I1E5V2_9GLOM|nr:hypothetical protein GLOIN_2v1648756 [Rhizophagus irregularis DAOM 181602=DAOM 197198]PKC06493.1 hypothetical protein RhiirA5_360193 [Rhizophagus irregularis]PKC59449.1 hypothetical protein RhiirA1_426938 [Rhizophagus irregularis]PKY17511.1 hypothetical protein RhiirB3_404401 [Rhizophagus irregularis]POG67308.1 hypothetical protein GLOIN_2v1648756 [Rhizophagus irregularis DAOM 181602=DAOM 197198]CAB4481421.1 unnamed protein product [Rhizophagus irregularis]|eukprot:XP_025174174.1 hypothetical protein GLOIN_2v1648756 [Rhizophagus irregularis DAOM 181602=DAOM 197198]
MSSRSHIRGTPYAQKINSNNHNGRTTKRSSSKLCPNCNETKDCVKLFSNKVKRIEEIINNYKNFPKKNTNQSLFMSNFTLNNKPYKSEYDLSNFTLENLQNLVIFITQNCNNDNKTSCKF